MLHALLKLLQGVLWHHRNCNVVEQPLTDSLSTSPASVAIKHSKEHALGLEKKQRYALKVA